MLKRTETAGLGNVPCFKRVDFDVHFASTAENEKRLKELFERNNSIFRWFSYLYLQHLKTDSNFSDDELYIARAVMHRLYEHAGREAPQFFLDEPIGRKYDLGKNR